MASHCGQTVVSDDPSTFFSTGPCRGLAVGDCVCCLSLCVMAQLQKEAQYAAAKVLVALFIAASYACFSYLITQVRNQLVTIPARH